MTPLPRIGIDATAAIHQRAGIGRSVRELVRALAALKPDLPLRLFVAGAHRADLAYAPGSAVYRPSRFSEMTHARLWHRLRAPLPVELWTGPLDLFHATDFALPPTRPRTRTVATVHDLAFERYPDETMPGMLDYLKRVAPRSARRADAIIAVSQATRQDLIELYGIPAEKIHVVYHGVTPDFCPERDPAQEAETRQRYQLPEGPLLLTVGTLQPRKNHLRLVQAFARTRQPAALVIAGSPGWAYGEVRGEVEHLNLRRRVRFVEWVEDRDLPALYRMATAFVFPSLYEGFGLPVLEAMASGAPVIASRASSLPEVVGEAGVLVDPLDVDGLAAAMDALLSDADRHAALREAGLARASNFTWAKAARQTWAVYESLLG